MAARYFLRCAKPIGRTWEKSDDERPVTKRRKKEMHEVAKFFGGLKALPELIVTSPLSRVWQTAEVAAEHLQVKCHQDKLLAPGVGRQELERVLTN